MTPRSRDIRRTKLPIVLHHGGVTLLLYSVMETIVVKHFTFLYSVRRYETVSKTWYITLGRDAKRWKGPPLPPLVEDNLISLSWSSK